MSVAESKAERVLEGMGENRYGSAALFLAIVAVVVAGVALFVACNKKAQQTHQCMKNLNFLQKRRLRRLVHEKVEDSSIWDAVYHGVLQQAPLLTLEEVKALYEEAK